MDHPPIRGIRRRRDVEPRLSRGLEAGRAGLVGGLRPADPSRLRFRRPSGAGRCRHGRRGRRLGRRYAAPVRRHCAGPCLGIDDHEWCGAPRTGSVPGRGRGIGRPVRTAARHHPERHPQGVHGPEHLDPCAAAVAAHRHRRGRMAGCARAEVQRHVDLGLSLPGSGRRSGAGTGVNTGQCQDLCRSAASARP
ncbi:hypothetical protein D3C72_1139830 [compost metagenome]